MLTAAKLYEAANRASREAIIWARDPAGAGLARLRRQDARALRRLARDILAESAA